MHVTMVPPGRSQFEIQLSQDARARASIELDACDDAFFAELVTFTAFAFRQLFNMNHRVEYSTALAQELYWLSSTDALLQFRDSLDSPLGENEQQKRRFIGRLSWSGVSSALQLSPKGFRIFSSDVEMYVGPSVTGLLVYLVDRRRDEPDALVKIAEVCRLTGVLFLESGCQLHEQGEMSVFAAMHAAGYWTL